MAERKKTTTTKQTKPRSTSSSARRTPAVRQKTTASIMEYFRFGESYTSLVLGIVVVIIATILLVSLFKTRTNLPVDPQQGTSSTNTTIAQENRPSVSPTPSPTAAQKTQTGERTYVVKPGDDLWKIAQSQYKDGYKWVEIACANNLTNPGVINVGNKLVIPSIAQGTPTGTVSSAEKGAPQPISQPQTISGTAYTVVKGDYLWNIAIRAYGTGYKWVDIAKANNLVNPNIIHPGNKLTLPR